MKNEPIKQFNMLQIILLHLLPGIPILLLALFFSSPFIGIEFPFILSLFLAIAIGLVPTQLSILLFIAKHSRKEVKEIILNTKTTSIFQMVLWVFILLTINGLAFAFIPQLEQPLRILFAWIPDWARLSIEAVKSQPELVWPTIILGLLMNGLLGPIVEELYFRGFLLPRMGKLGRCAPAVNAALFSLYHLFSPWEFFTRIVAVLPYAYIVWRKKDLRIGILVHCLGNTLGLIGTIAALLG